MTRLTNAQRERIVAAAIRNTFQKRETEIKEGKAKLGEAIRIAILGKHRKAYEALPTEWHSERKGIYVTGYREHKYSYRSNAFLIDGPSPLGSIPLDDLPARVKARVVALGQKEDALEFDKDSLSSKVRGTVYAATTEKALLDAWPEAKDFMYGEPDEKIGDLLKKAKAA